MKSKFLLSMSFAVALTCAVKAQISKSPSNDAYKIDVRAALKQEHSLQIADQNSQATLQANPATSPAKNYVVRHHSQGNHTNNACSNSLTVAPLCGGPNGLTVLARSRSNINYNKDVNSVMVIHRAKIGTPPSVQTTGYYVIDVNSNPTNNSTWQTCLGPVYSDPKPDANGGWYRGRYPAADIYNPPGNTNPANAYAVYMGPWTSAAASPVWQGRVSGVSKLDGTGIKQHIDSLTPTNYNPFFFDPNVFTTKSGNVWRIGFQLDAAAFYNDSLQVGKGWFDQTAGDFGYTDFKLACPTDTNFGLGEADIVFADDNITGYIVAVTNNDKTHTCLTDTTIYLTIYKTTDGGKTWSSNIDPDLQHAFDGILSGGGTTTYGCFVDIDPVVDMNGNLHINTGIFPSVGYSVYTTPGKWGQFDLYTVDHGTTWKAELLDKPETFSGTWVGSAGNYVEYNRPFAARTTDGSKLFFGWFDTDTSTFGSASGNFYPDLHVRAYDVATDKWTPAQNVTGQTAADGQCTFGNGSYYVMDNGGIYTIPLFFQGIISTIDNPTSMNYVNGACINGADFTLTGSPVDIPLLTCTPVQPPQAFPNVNVATIAANSKHLVVAGNYPNPFNGTTTIALSLPKAGDVTVEVTNMVGQVLFTKTYQNLIAGKNSLTLDCSSFAAGLYVYKVKAGDEVVTSTMTVK